MQSPYRVSVLNTFSLNEAQRHTKKLNKHVAHTVLLYPCFGSFWGRKRLKKTLKPKREGKGERERESVTAFKFFLFLLSMKKSEVHMLSLQNKSTPVMFINHPFLKILQVGLRTLGEDCTVPLSTGQGKELLLHCF